MGPLLGHSEKNGGGLTELAITCFHKKEKMFRFLFTVGVRGIRISKRANQRKGLAGLLLGHSEKIRSCLTELAVI